MSWRSLTREEPELADKGRRRFERDGVPMAFMATVTERGTARLSPVCPIFCDDEIYLSVGAHTPKCRDLTLRGTYALHAFLGPHDEEFQISGSARLVQSEDEKYRVHQAIAFPVFNTHDPVFCLLVERCLWAYWDAPSEKPGQRRTWRNLETKE